MIAVLLGIVCIIQGLIYLIAYTPFYHRWFKGDPLFPLVAQKDRPNDIKMRFVISKVIGAMSFLIGVGLIVSAI